MFKRNYAKKQSAYNKYLRAICVLLGTAFALSFTAACFAAKSPQTVRVAVINYPNYIQMDENGAVSGYAYEYLEEIKKYTDWQYEYISMSLSEATEALEQGNIDVLAGTQYTPERGEHFDYSKRDMGEGGSVLCVRLDDSRYCFNDFAAFDGMKIAALAGTVRIKQAQKKFSEYGSVAEFVEFDTDEEAKAALQDGTVDAVLMSTIRCETQYKMLARINSAPLFFCTNRQRPEIKAGIDMAMEEIHLVSPYYEEELDKKYYGSIPIQLAFTKAEKDYIAAVGPISVAVSDDLAPVEYYSESDGRYHGVVPDSFGLISEYSGLRFRFTSRKDMSTLKKQLVSDNIQLVASVANETWIAELWGVTLTSPYYDNSVSMIINNSVSDYRSSSCSVILRSGYPYFEQLARAEGYTDIQFAESFTDCVSAVDKKKADLTFVPSNCVNSLMKKPSYSGLSAYLMPDTYTGFSIGVPQSADPLLLSILNKSIASITKGQRTELLVQNLAETNGDISMQEFIAAHRFTLTLLALVVAVIIILIFSYWAYSRKRTNRQLKLAYDKAESANRAKTEFLARMSHDMRTPINGILGLSYLMEDQNDAQEMKKELPQLREAGEYLLQLINDVLDVNKVESGNIELHPIACDSKQVFSSIVSMVRQQTDAKGIEFNVEERNIEWRYLMLDVQRVKQIFINLLSNAAKFTPQGGRIDFIVERVSTNERFIRDRFVVRDNGIGMTESFLPRLFEPFAQENRAPGVTEGTGLGLTIVKKLVELMGGSIEVKSRENEGTEFTLLIDCPLADAPADKAQQRMHDATELSPDKRILLCEDHPLNAQIAARLLQKQGAAVTIAENGQLGLEAFAQSAPNFYDAILMDIRMPVMDGIEATKAIRALDRDDASSVPIIAMTANAYDVDVTIALSAGMNAYLAKPIEPKEMFSTIAKQIATREQ